MRPEAGRGGVAPEMTEKTPSFQFYPADWRKDPGVQALDYFDRGVWFEILCIMFESEQRGKLMLNGQKMPEEALARLLGLDNQKITTTLTTLLKYGVAKVEPDTGIIYCKRMVEDERLRQIRRDCGSMGGNPQLKKGQRNPYYPPDLVNQKDNQKITPSFSSSSSNNKKNYTSDSIEYGLAEHLFSLIKNRNPEHKEPNLQVWARYVDRMIKIDKRDPDKIRAVVDWCQNDRFWRDNILSTSALREKYDRLVLKMRETNGPAEQPENPVDAEKRKRGLL